MCSIFYFLILLYILHAIVLHKQVYLQLIYFVFI